MNRRLIAFIIAPLSVPVMLGHYLYSLTVTPTWFAMALMLSIVVSYSGVLIFGIPIYLLARTWNWTAFWIAPLVGFIVGGIIWFTFGMLLALLLDQGFAGVRAVLTNSSGLGDVLWPFGPVGAVVGMIFWIIARPDKRM